MPKQGDDVMKTLKTRNGILFLLLMAGLIFNILWSVRLELKAATAESLVDEHHNELKKNRDTLDVQEFARFVKSGAGAGNRIWITNEGMELSADEQRKSINLDNKGMIIGVKSQKTGDKIINITEDYIFLSGAGGDGCEVMLSKASGFKCQVLPKQGLPFNFSMDPELKEIYMGVGPKDFYVKLDTGKQQIEVKKDNSVIRIGKGDFGEGIELGEFDTGTIAVNKGKGVGIAGKEELRITFDGEINITSKGNISIRSEQGDVKINGKKLLLNE